MGGNGKQRLCQDHTLMSLALIYEHRGAMGGVRGREYHDQTDFRMIPVGAKQRCLWGPLRWLWQLSRVVVRMERHEI